MIIQKPVVDSSKTNRYKIVARDETGEYTPSNTTGYGGTNGSPKESFSRYIVDYYNTLTNESYRKIITDITSPNVLQVVAKNDFELTLPNVDDTFKDGVYKMTLNVEINETLGGEGYENTDTVVNVAGAQTLANNYQAIIVGDEIYNITSASSSTLILARPIKTTFTSFKPALNKQTTFVLNDILKDYIIHILANTLDCCNMAYSCDDRALQLSLLQFGLDVAIEEGDFPQANEYLTLMYKLCTSTKKCKSC